jgi:hypothetical protein
VLVILFLMPFPAWEQSAVAQNNSNQNNLTQASSNPVFNTVVPNNVVPLHPFEPTRPIGFPSLARAAGIIFSGTVARIEPRPASGAQPVATIAIIFHVENAIRGATPGQDLTILQWIGAWSGGQRYRVGERVFLFLYPPSRLGLTSTVGGPMGRFGIDPWGRIPLTAQHLSAFRSDPILGGKASLRFSDFVLAVQRASPEAGTER